LQCHSSHSSTIAAIVTIGQVGRGGLHERTQHRRLVALPGGGQDHHRLATAFDPKVQLGGVAAAATPWRRQR